MDRVGIKAYALTSTADDGRGRLGGNQLEHAAVSDNSHYARMPYTCAMHRTTDVDRLATAASNYAEAYGAADAIARVALIEAEDGRLSADRIAEYRALLDETKGGVA